MQSTSSKKMTLPDAVVIEGGVQGERRDVTSSRGPATRPHRRASAAPCGTFAQPTLRAIDEQPNAHASGDQPHVMSQEVLPLFQGGQRCLLGDDLGGVILGRVIRVRVVGMAVVSVAGWLIVSPLLHVSGCGGRSSRPPLVGVTQRFRRTTYPSTCPCCRPIACPPGSRAGRRRACDRDRRDRSCLPGTSSVA